jgi:hypothetical protein
MADNIKSIKVDVYFGDHDWADDGGARRLIEQK